MLEGLLNQAPTNNVLRSNLANSHRVKAEVLLKRWYAARQQADFEDAVEAYLAAIELREALVDKDKENARWRFQLAPVYSGLGQAYQLANDIQNALMQYEKELKLRKWLVKKDPTNEVWQRNLKEAEKKIADLKAA